MDDYSFNILLTYLDRGSLSIYDLCLLCNCNDSDIAGFVKALYDKQYLVCECLLDEKSDHLSYKAKLILSSAGRSALNIEQKKRRASKMSTVRSWISLILSIIAIVVSVVS